MAAGNISPPPVHGLQDYSPTGPRGPIVEKRRLASYDEALFIITTSPLDISPAAPARPLPTILPSGDSWYFTAALASRNQTEAIFAKAACCYRLYGDHHVKIAPDRKLFSART